MPLKPKVPCKHPGCPELVSVGQKYCENHKALHPEEQRSAATRGYNSKWRRESKKFLEIHPLCVRCLEKGIATPATVVDLVGKAKYWSFGVFADMFERIGMANILFRPLYFKRIIKTHGREVF